MSDGLVNHPSNSNHKNTHILKNTLSCQIMYFIISQMFISLLFFPKQPPFFSHFGGVSALPTFSSSSSSSSYIHHHHLHHLIPLFLSSSMNPSCINLLTMIPNSELMKFQEAATNSLTSAHHLFNLISMQTTNSNNHELSLIAHTAISQFKSLVSMLDHTSSCSMSKFKRIRKGPLPNFQDVDIHQFMDSRIQILQRPLVVRNPVIQPFNVCLNNKQQLLNNYFYCYSSMSAQQSSGGESSFLSSKKRNGGLKCTVSAGGCHCSKRRQVFGFFVCLFVWFYWN